MRRMKRISGRQEILVNTPISIAILTVAINNETITTAPIPIPPIHQPTNEPNLNLNKRLILGQVGVLVFSVIVWV